MLSIQTVFLKLALCAKNGFRQQKLLGSTAADGIDLKKNAQTHQCRRHNSQETQQSEDPELKNDENGHMHTCLEGWQFNNDQVKLLTVLKISLENTV